MQTLTVSLIKHAQSFNHSGLSTQESYRDVRLTPRGNAQAKELAQQIKTCPNVIISSPFARALATAEPLHEKYPSALLEIWPIQELTYLSPVLCRGTDRNIRRPMVDDYWQRLDPDYVHGEQAESFTQFIERLRGFHHRLQHMTGLVIVVGHGMFLSAYLLGYRDGFEASSEWMKKFKEYEATLQMKNCEIKTLHMGATGE